MKLTNDYKDLREALSPVQQWDEWYDEDELSDYQNQNVVLGGGGEVEIDPQSLPDDALKYIVAADPDTIAGLLAERDALLKALKKAVQLAEVASDWNLEEVEIDGEMAPTYSLASEFRAAIAAAEGKQP